jgi:PAS domain S-box-containing protein
LRRAAVYPAILMTAVAVALVGQVVSLRHLAAQEHRSDEVIGRAATLALLLTEHEAGLRGWLLTGQQDLLDRYRAAAAEVGPALEALERLVADDAAQVKRLHRIGALVASWHARADLAARGHPPGGAAESLERTVARKAIMDEARAEAYAFGGAEELLRAERSARVTAASRWALGSTLALALLVGVALALVARAQTRRVARVYRRTTREAQARADALGESEERFRLFVEGVRDAAVYMLDGEGRVRSWNEGAARIKGWAEADVVGQHMSVFYVPEDVAEGVPERELEAAARDGQVEGESWRLRRDGSRFWAAVTLRALRGRDGRLVGYAKLVRDTTGRKRAEMRRAALDGLARALSEAGSSEEALPRVLAEVGPALGYDLAVAWEARAGRLELAARWSRPSPALDAFAAAAAARRQPSGEGLAGGVLGSGEAGWVEDMSAELPRLPLGPLALEAGLRTSLAFPVRGGGEVALVVQLWAGDPRPRDPDLLAVAAALAVPLGAWLERRREEAAAREAERRRAEELERRVDERTAALTAVNAELEAFSYSVSHDLRAPLRAMDGFSQVLLEDYAPRLDDTGREYLGRIRAGSQRMSRLIDDLIQLSRVTRGELRREPVDLSQLVREVAAEVAEREPSRRVVVEVQDAVLVRGDARLLRAGLVNLVGNAFKFTRNTPEPWVGFGASEGPDGRTYHVRDNGAGFDMAYAGKLFQPFQRLHAPAEFEGTGIGLATWQRIVHRHGGRVWAEGAPGRGATFYFTLGAY